MKTIPFCLWIIGACLTASTLHAQWDECQLPKSAHSDFRTVDVEQARCLARHSGKERTLFYSYADWCTHCKARLPDIVRLAQEYDAAFYLLLVDEENETYYSINPTAAMLDTVYHNTLNAVIITDSLFSPKAYKSLQAPIRKIIDIRGRNARDKYYRFLCAVNPDDEAYNRQTPMGVSIVMDQWGNTVGVAEKDFDRPDTPLKGYEPIAELLKH